MNEPRPGSSFAAQSLIVVLILVALAWVVLPVVRDARGPAGDPIPARPPDERNRVRHPLGFSIVVPPDWDHHVGTDGGPLTLTPMTPGRTARRSRAMIVVTPLGSHRPEHLERLRPTSFQGREAFEEMRMVRPWTFDDGAWSEYTLSVSHDGDWYEVRYGIAEERTRLPGEVRRYLDTLRWDLAR